MDKIEVEIWACTNLVGSETRRVIKVDRDDWEDMSEAERDDLMQESLFDLVEWGWSVKE